MCVPIKHWGESGSKGQRQSDILGEVDMNIFLRGRRKQDRLDMAEDEEAIFTKSHPWAGQRTKGWQPWQQLGWAEPASPLGPDGKHKLALDRLLLDSCTGRKDEPNKTLRVLHSSFVNVSVGGTTKATCTEGILGNKIFSRGETTNCAVGIHCSTAASGPLPTDGALNELSCNASS